MDDRTIEFWTDGAYSPCNSNGKAKGGWAFYCPQYNLKVAHGELNTTNNRMEITAAIKALEWVDESNIEEKNIIIYSDSMYLVETMKGNYTKKKNLDLWSQLDQLVSDLVTKHITWKHVKGHTGERNENDVVDKLANLVSQI